MKAKVSQLNVFTTGQIAHITSVATRTVVKWIESGRLKGYKIPGSNHTRVVLNDLIEFMQANGFPTSELAALAVAQVLLVTQDRDVISGLQRESNSEFPFRLVTVESGDSFEVGSETASFKPDCIVIDFEQPCAVSLCAAIRRRPAFAETILIALAPSDRRSIAQSAINEVVRRPFDVTALARRIHRLIGSRKDLAARQFPSRRTRRADEPPQAPVPAVAQTLVGTSVDAMEWL
jgi:excisionase family DNA binding protein